MDAKDDQLQQKDTQLQRKDAQLQRKDTQLQQKDAQLQQRDTQLQRKDAQLHQKDTQIQQQGTELREKATQINRQQKELQTLRVRNMRYTIHIPILTLLWLLQEEKQQQAHEKDAEISRQQRELQTLRVRSFMHADDLCIKSQNLICVIIFYFQDQNVAQDERLTAVQSQLQQLQVGPQLSCNYAVSSLRLRTAGP